MRKQLFYLTNHELTAYSWNSKNALLEDIFENDENGWQRFAEYVAIRKNLPAEILVDLIEEDFQRDTIPHTVGKGRRALIERKLTQLYRDTPFRHATPQGREKTGRKDDRILFSALTNAELPKPWLNALLIHTVPVIGIYSLALLSQVLFNKLKFGTAPVLLVTHQSSGLRQSYFHEGHLHFSRLTPLLDQAPELLAESLISESLKTRQYLASTRVLARGVPVQVVVIAEAHNLVAVQEQAANNPDPNAEYRFLPIDEVSQQLKQGSSELSEDCDELLLSLLGKERVSSHYPLREQNRFYQLWQARIGLYVLSILLGLAALAWAGIDLMTIFEQRRETTRLEQEALAAESKYEIIVKNMPSTLVTPHNMKSVVNIERMMVQNVALPNELMSEVSRALDALPQIVIKQLQWKIVDPAMLSATVDPNSPPPPIDTGAQPIILGLPDKPAEILLIDGEIQPFDGDYRAALDSVRMLVATLQKNPHLKVTVTLQPIDTNPSVKLENKAGDPAADLIAAFSIKLVRTP
ncbi:MAG: hypothetical protein Q7T66_12440 [Herminiimonas sp.]|uniref:hypothetical protein n=1 Tax=Herminiimonas sp. TaxID=1926289 RepID=UPI00271DA091|nr:hypothetical protein [Herminiimonas sp.]MDO9421459.1 hypothetical protein [Herminiimonas sp.]